MPTNNEKKINISTSIPDDEKAERDFFIDLTINIVYFVIRFAVIVALFVLVASLDL